MALFSSSKGGKVAKIIKLIEPAAVVSNRYVCHNHDSHFDFCVDIQNILAKRGANKIIIAGTQAEADKEVYKPGEPIKKRGQIANGLWHIFLMSIEDELFQDAYIDSFFRAYFTVLKCKPESAECGEYRKIFDDWMKGDEDAKGLESFVGFLKDLCYGYLSEDKDEMKGQKEKIKSLATQTKVGFSAETLTEWAKLILHLKGSEETDLSTVKIQLQKAAKKYL